MPSNYESTWLLSGRPLSGGQAAWGPFLEDLFKNDVISKDCLGFENLGFSWLYLLGGGGGGA
jgi:hypothetical protein